jgi:DNA-directed RNA polymerase specialized sigma24 family protein
MRVGITEKLWNAEIVIRMKEKGYTVKSLTLDVLNDPIVQELKFSYLTIYLKIISMRTLKYRMPKLQKNRKKERVFLYALSSLLDADPEQIYPEVLRDLPRLNTEKEKTIWVDNAMLQKSLRSKAALPPGVITEEIDAKDKIDRAMEKLTAREKQVIQGILDGHKIPDLAKQWGLSGSRIRQLKFRAENKMRKEIEIMERKDGFKARVS